MTKKNIGLVCSSWFPPVYGGAEIYCSRLAYSLRELGVNLSAITAMRCREELQRNDDPSWLFRTNMVDDLQGLQTWGLEGGNAWYDAVVQWAQEKDLSTIILNIPARYPSLSNRLQSHGFKVGAIVHDAYTPSLWNTLIENYWQTRNWDSATEETLRSVKGERSITEQQLQGTYDFVITNSEWACNWVSYDRTLPHCVVHPIIRVDTPSSDTNMSKVTVGMLNPNLIKGAVLMAGMAVSAPKDWTFRALHGGWGEAAQLFQQMTYDVAPIQGRLDMVDHIPNISNFYASSKVFVTPSRFEGYGMAPVESMYCGTPAVVSDLPTIKEGVGDAAFSVPYFASSGDWIDAIEEVLAEREVWMAKAKQRRIELEAREKQELNNLIQFINSI